jgi:DNA-binding protein H-NS
VSFAQEIKEFVAAFTGVSRVLGTADDRAAKKLRNQLMQFKLQQAQQNMNIKNQLMQERKAAETAAKAGATDRINEIGSLGAKRGSGPTPLDPSGSRSGSLEPSEVGDPTERAHRAPTPAEYNWSPTDKDFDQLPTSVESGGEGIPTDDVNRDMGFNEEDEEGGETDYGGLPLDDDEYSTA